MKRTLLGLLVVASGIACTAWGQDQPDQEDGPGRGVARISLMNGDVSVRRGDSGEMVAAALNAPLVVEDQLLTGPDSRAEVQFDYANMLRLAAMSEVRISELENQRLQLQVARGLVTFRVLRDMYAESYRSELARAIYGANPLTAGEVQAGASRVGSTPAGSLRAGVAMIPESRKDDGLFLRFGGLSTASLQTGVAALVLAARQPTA